MAKSQSWTLLHARVHQTLRQRKLLQRQQRLLLAVSGGQDSLCLLKLFSDLQSKWDWQLAIAHCDHRWATDVGIAAHVEQIAQCFALPFYLKTAPEVKETEAAARQWRYQALAEIANEQGFSAVVTGHTRSDRAETFMYNLLRGAGTDGLQAIAWHRSLTPTVELVRPLLNISRTETGEFCQQFQLPVWEDLANRNLNYARNRLRHQVFPDLKAHFNPQVETAIAQTAEVLRAEVEYLNQCAEELFEQAIASEEQTTSPKRINRLRLRHAPLALQRRVMRRFLQCNLRSAPTFEQIEALTHLIDAPNRTRTASLPLDPPEHPKPLATHAEVEGDWIVFKCAAMSVG